MSLLINMPNRSSTKLVAALSQFISPEEIEVWPDVRSPEKVTMALLWQHQHGSLLAYKNLQAISSFGAGVDFIVSDRQLPHLPIARIVDPMLATQMKQYVFGVIQHHRLRLEEYRIKQSTQLWQPKGPHKGNTIAILGLGQIGTEVGRFLHSAGFNVIGWSHSEKNIKDITSFTGEVGLKKVVSQADYLVCLLPLTPSTQGILNKSLFSLMPSYGVLINVARGAHLNETDLLKALNNDEIKAAYLDVFQQEPLTNDHPFWQHEKITITPHVSAITSLETAVAQIVENYKRCQSGEEILHSINRDKGY
jgi:glyoxylate/hydroxypyruvate reductase A